MNNKTWESTRGVGDSGAEARELDKAHPCQQCGRDMGFEYFLGPVCGRCCRENHRKVIGKR